MYPFQVQDGSGSWIVWLFKLVSTLFVQHYNLGRLRANSELIFWPFILYSLF